ncbi:type I polyketide synthase [Chitinophaga solisilvae]|uniref:type I polyketide synthase n=1 Tax=Chitinophaga solisilvae TaxID=1233460 RepID=UPI00137191E7|nr:beta-ketoacyl synthase N-terminal-like domain-containing protein [Chitinophaga solisilvae]
MSAKAVLEALQAGKISITEAREKLAELKQAAGAVKNAPEQQVANGEAYTSIDAAERIAIVGMSGRYPGAAGLHQYWDNLAQGKDAVREVPADRWDVNAYFAPLPYQPGKVYCKWLGALDDIAMFDPLFFGITPLEAEGMDPQQRLFLQEAYHAFEDAGYTRQMLSNRKCGVYLGIMSNEYSVLQYKSQAPSANITGNSFSIAAARVSYSLNLKGPAIAIDTACSSSLVATHLACQALLNGEVDMALAGGVTLYLTVESYMGMCGAGMLSPEGRCKTFDNGANGFVPGEGAGTLVLKRLKDAVADNDNIYGVIIGSGINQDGKTNGMTAPSINSQIELERDVYNRYNIAPQSISYVEMHGTGTKLGDPIELEALAAVFREKTDLRHFCALGSVKSNIGHTSAAAGVASVQKVLLAMQHKQLVPTLHFSTHNEHFDFETSPFYVNTSLRPWTTAGEKRRAAVSSFGYSGTNAHLVIEEYISQRSTATASGGPSLFVLSARSEEQLKEYAASLFRHCSSTDTLHLQDVAYTLQVGRQPMEHRLAFTADTKEQLLEKLQGFLEGNSVTGLLQGSGVKTKTLTAAEHATLLDTFGRHKDWLKIAERWIQGAAFGWEQLYDTVKPRRISLPTYPFARERYWVPDIPAAPLSQERINAAPAAPRRAYFLEKQWEVAAPVNPSLTAARSLIIVSAADTQSLAEAVAAHFPGSRILYADTAPTYNQTAYSGCIDLTGCSTQSLSADWWLPLQQMLAEEAKESGSLLLAVSRGLEAADSAGHSLNGALAAGLFRMLQSEYRQLRSRHMDAPAALPDNELAALIAQEYHHAGEEIAIAWRNGTRYQAVLSEVALPPAASRLRFHPDEALLITGGTRGIGYLCAKHFVTHYGVKKIILLSRQPLAADDPRLTTLTNAGATVEVINTPLTDQPALEWELARLEAGIGRIAGVIHSAGLTDPHNPAFIRKRKEDIAAVLSPKVAGLDVLYSIFRDRPLHCFVLFSSVSAIVPALGAGQADYVMANAYMDYLAAAHTGVCPLVSIQWPSWKETGMGEVTTRAYQDSGLLTLLNTEGLSLLDQVLQSGRRGVIMPVVADPQMFVPAQLLTRPQAVISVNVSSPVQKETLPGTSLLSAATQWLLELFSKELKIPVNKLDADTAFQDYGVDSILLAQLLRRINQEIPAPLDPSLLYEYPTLSSLSGWLVTHHGAALANVTGDGAAEDTMQLPAAVTVPVATVRRQQQPARLSGDIAVVGMSCRFAGADNLDAYWDLLSGGRSGITQVNVTQEGQPVYGGMLSSKKTMDTDFFLIPPADAAAMDPQALLLLEESLQVMYHAGYRHTEFKGSRTGVYIGGRSQHQPSSAALSAARNPVVAVGQNYLSANISQFFDLRGPAVVVDTACSSALVSLHMACQALQTGDIDTALAGGITLLEGGAALHLFGQRGLLNNSGFFHVFDERASGVLLSEGAGMVMLKRLEDAEAAGDRIYGVIRAVAVNNDGRTPGPASPNLQAQKEVMQQALQRSGYDATDISYIEANGSGTEVTDLLELKAIGEVYRNGLKVPCGLGCIKPNIGHPLCAEGMAGLIKVLLMLHHREQVPFLSGQQAMRHYDLSASPFEFSRERRSWNASPAVAGLNCFADGGTNVHVIVTTGTDIRQLSHTREPLPLPPAARTQEGSNRPVAVPQATNAWKKIPSAEKAVHQD